MNRVARKEERGLALLLVLWVVVLLAVMATALTRTQRVQVAMTRNLEHRAAAQELLEAGLNFMMAQLEFRGRPAPENRWPVDGKLHPWSFAGHRLWIGAEPEAARLDINLADEDGLQNLLLALLPDPHQATALRDAILDWRDADHFPGPFGAEDEDYLASGRPAGARDAPLASIQELVLVKGMSRDLLQALAPLVTIHGDQQGVDLRFARDTLRHALQNGAFPTAGLRSGRAFPAHHRFRLHAELESDDGTILRQNTVVDTRFSSARGYRAVASDLHPGWSLPRTETESGHPAP